MENNNPHFDETPTYRVQISRRINLGFWKGCGIIAIALLIAKLTVPSIVFNNPFSFVGLVLVIWFLNLLLRPLLIVFTLPFILLTLGAGVILVNALVIWASTLVPGIYLKSFWIALWAGFLIEAISWIFALFESEKFFKRNSSRRDDDTIDIK